MLRLWAQASLSGPFTLFFVQQPWGVIADDGFFDSDAEHGNMDTKYEGVFAANWAVELHPNCKQQYGPIRDTVLRLGPARRKGSKNPYYLSLSASGPGDFKFNIQTSLSTKDKQLEWWEVNAERMKNGDGYTLSGGLRKPESEDEDSINKISGKANKDCGFGDDGVYSWTHPNNSITFDGLASPKNATLKGSGMYEVAEGNWKITYTFSFTGVWEKGSAELNTKEDKPSWTDDPTKTSSAVPEVVTVHSGATTVRPSYAFSYKGVLSTSPSSLLVDDSPAPSGARESSPTSSSSPRLGRGAVTGITIGSISAFALLLAVGFWLYHRYQNKKESNQVYPELAYLYTPSPGPGLYTRTNSAAYSHVDYQNGYSSPPPPVSATEYRGAASGDLEMREGFLRETDHAGETVPPSHSGRRY